MSKQNKVNPGMYTQAGRLSPDDAARERQHQIQTASTRRTAAPSRRSTRRPGA